MWKTGRWISRKFGATSQNADFLAGSLRRARDALRPQRIDLSGFRKSHPDGGRAAFSRAFADRSERWLNRRQRMLALQGWAALLLAAVLPLAVISGALDMYPVVMPPIVALLCLFVLHCLFHAWQMRRRRLAPLVEFLAGLPHSLID